MCKRILTLMAATLTATACAHGARPTPEVSPPNLVVSAAQLAIPAAQLPQPASGKRSDLLANHVEVARAYHDLRADHVALVCTVLAAKGITVNGGAGVPAAAWCAFWPRVGP